MGQFRYFLFALIVAVSSFSGGIKLDSIVARGDTLKIKGITLFGDSVVALGVNFIRELNNKLGLHATADSALGSLRLSGLTKTYYDTVGNGSNRNRANHTGTQAISTIVNLQSTLDSKSDTNHNHLNDWTYIGVTHYNTSPYPKYWYNVYSLTGTGRGDEDIEVLYHGDANYYYGQCILRLKIVRYNGEPANQLHITVTPVSGWAANGLVKIDGGNVWVASSTIWGNIKARLVQSMYNPGRSLFGTTPTSTEPDGVRIDGTFGIRTFNGDAQVVMAHPLICSNAYVDGNQTITGLTASQIVETNASKQLVSVAKGTAYNASYAGSGTKDSVARSDHGHSTLACNTATIGVMTAIRSAVGREYFIGDTNSKFEVGGNALVDDTLTVGSVSPVKLYDGWYEEGSFPCTVKTDCFTTQQICDVKYVKCGKQVTLRFGALFGYSNSDYLRLYMGWPERIKPYWMRCNLGYVWVNNTAWDDAVLEVVNDYGMYIVRILTANKSYNNSGERKGLYNGSCATYYIQ